MAGDGQGGGMSVTNVEPDTLAGWVDAGDTLIVDVREEDEYAAERIEGARLVPLSRFDPALVREVAGDRRVVFQCRSGKRSVDAAIRYRMSHDDDGGELFHLAGGIMAWRASGQPVVEGPPTAGPA